MYTKLLYILQFNNNNKSQKVSERRVRLLNFIYLFFNIKYNKKMLVLQIILLHIMKRVKVKSTKIILKYQRKTSNIYIYFMKIITIPTENSG